MAVSAWFRNVAADVGAFTEGSDIPGGSGVVCAGIHIAAGKNAAAITHRRTTDCIITFLPLPKPRLGSRAAALRPATHRCAIREPPRSALECPRPQSRRRDDRPPGPGRG